MQVEQVLKTRGRATEIKELKKKEIQLEIQFQKTEDEEAKHAEYEQATSLLGKLDEKEQQMVMKLKATQAKESVAKVELQKMLENQANAAREPPIQPPVWLAMKCFWPHGMKIAPSDTLRKTNNIVNNQHNTKQGPILHGLRAYSTKRPFLSAQMPSFSTFFTKHRMLKQTSFSFFINIKRLYFPLFVRIKLLSNSCTFLQLETETFLLY